MAKTHLNGKRERTFDYEGKTVVALRPTNWDRERMRKLLLRVNAMNTGYSGSTIAEFSVAVCYVTKGDEHVWSRPSENASDSELRAALEDWLHNVDGDYIDLLDAAISTKADPVSAPTPLAETADPN